jgi:hypothetical protein
MASRKRITSHKKSRQQKEFRGIAQRRDPEFYGEELIDIPYRDMTPARKEAPTPARKEAPTPKVLPKSKPKKKSSGVNFDTTGTLPGKTIKGKKYGGAMMKARGGTFKGVF